MVTLTQKAQDTLRRLITQADGDADGLRIVVDARRCSGLQYMLGLENAAYGGDRVFAFGDVKVYVDPDSLPMVDGLQVDVVEGTEGSGFVFDNPNAKGVCACGKSLSG